MSIANLFSFWTFPSSEEVRLSTIKLKATTHLVFLYENSTNQIVQEDFLCKKKYFSYFFLQKKLFSFFPGEARASAPQRSYATALPVCELWLSLILVLDKATSLMLVDIVP